MAEKLADATEGQYVVVHDAISFRDPEDRDRGTLKRDEYTFLNATRGEEVPEGVSGGELKRLLDLGAITDTDSAEGKLAKTGLPRSESLRPPAGAIPFARSANEETQVMKATLSGIPGPENTQSSRAELARLPGEHLAVMARVLGVPVEEKASKADIIESILTGKGLDDVPSADEIAEQRQARDERQVAARDFGAEPGLVGENVRSDGTDREGGRKATDAQTKKSAGRSSSKTDDAS